MSTSAPYARSKGRPDRIDAPPGWRARRKRSIPLVVAGLLVVLGCGLASAQLAARAGDRVPVLAAARALPAGHVITPGDVQVVRVAADAEVRVVPVGNREHVVGTTTAVPVGPGQLLTSSALGTSRTPPRGQSVVGLALKPGQFPNGLEPGAAVRIFTGGRNATPVTVTGGSKTPVDPGGQVTGIVVSVEHAGDTSEAAISVTVQIPDASAAEIATAASAGSVSVVQIPAGG